MSLKLPEISLMSLFSVGAHRGNTKSKLNPELKDFIHAYSKNVALIDLVKTTEQIKDAANLMYKAGQRNQQILTVGTSQFLKDHVVDFSSSFTNPMPYVNHRWLGGNLSNWNTIRKTLKTLEKLRSMIANKEFFGKISKKEQLSLTRRENKLSQVFSGLVNLRNNRPGILVSLDPDSNPIAIKEADIQKIPVIAIASTNTQVIPAKGVTIVVNNKSLEAIKLITEILVQSYNQGLQDRVVTAPKNNDKASTRKPLKSGYNRNSNRSFNGARSRTNNFQRSSQQVNA